MYYSTITNQLYHIGHYILAVWILFIWCPRMIYPPFHKDKLVQTFANLLRIVGLYIIAGYILVGLKLFEVLAIIALLFFIIFRKYFLPNSNEIKMDALAAFNSKFYDFIETTLHLKLLWKRINLKKVLTDKRQKLFEYKITYILVTSILLLVLLSAFYVRFYDAWVSVAPSLSDGVVTLAWLKYINERILFHDGIYPQGLYIILAYLQKFAAIDAMYVAKYTGPFNGILIVISIYFFVSRLTSNKVAAIVAAMIYGLSGEALYGQDWFRQSATNAQEFALVFLLPTYYFFIHYFIKGHSNDFWTATMGCLVIGFIHSVIFAYTGLGLGILLLLVLFMGAERKRKFLKGVVSGISCVILSSLVPLGIGLLMGKELHSSSAQFATLKMEVALPPFEAWDMIGVIALIIVGIAGFLVKDLEKCWAYRFTFLFGTGCFLLYYFAGIVTQNAVLSSRTGHLWVLSICILIGFMWSACSSVLPQMVPVKFWSEILLCLFLFVTLVFHTKLQPISPYKMVWDSFAEQHLRIIENHQPSSWVIFSQVEGYSMAFGKGFHQYISTLLNEYDPNYFPLTKRGENTPDPNISYHIYIFEEKQVHKVDQSNGVYKVMEAEYMRRETEYEELREWLNAYKRRGWDLSTFYEDEFIKVHYIYRAVGKEAENEALWGKPRLSEMQKGL